MIDQARLQKSLIRYHRERRNAGDSVMAAACLLLVERLGRKTSPTREHVIEQITRGVDIARSRGDGESVYAGEKLLELISMTGDD